jgi:hypothetical protein
MNIVVFYGQRATFFDKGANVLKMRSMISHLSALDKKDPQVFISIPPDSHSANLA